MTIVGVVASPSKRGGGVPPLIAEAVLRVMPHVGIEVGAGGVTAWRNQGAGGATWDLAQSNSAKRPALDATGGRSGGNAVRFTSANFDRLVSASISADQPTTLVVVAKVDTSFTSGATIADGLALNNRRLYTGASDMRVYAGGNVTSAALSADTWYKFAGVYNGASSKNRVDATTVNGNAGASAANGIVLGCGGDADAAPFNGWAESALLFVRALSDSELAEVFAWLA